MKTVRPLIFHRLGEWAGDIEDALPDKVDRRVWEQVADPVMAASIGEIIMDELMEWP